jgi:hypothetical protein
MIGLDTVNSLAVCRLNAREIEALTPPRIYMGSAEPISKQRKVGSAKRSE